MCRCTGKTWPTAGQKNVDIKPVVNVMNFPYLGDLVVNK